MIFQWFVVRHIHNFCIFLACCYVISIIYMEILTVLLSKTSFSCRPVLAPPSVSQGAPLDEAVSILQVLLAVLSGVVVGGVRSWMKGARS